jgi:hypothetical protein
MDNGNELNHNKDFSTAEFKRIHKISDESFGVIDENPVKLLLIDENSSCQQQLVSCGILPMISQDHNTKWGIRY